MERHQRIVSQLTAAHTLLDDNRTKRIAVEKTLRDNEQQLVALANSRQLFDTLLDISRKDVQNKVCNVVSAALQKILDDPKIAIDVEFDIKRNQPEAQVVVKYDGKKGGSKIEDSFGGGVDDVVSIVLKIVIGQLLGVKGPIIADEPGKWLDDMGASMRFVVFLKQLSTTFNRQLILTTHKSELREAADKLIEVVNTDGYSRVS